MTRKAGILMPVSSLPSRYGIGTLGKEAYRFVDFLKKAGQSYWQVLPSGPTSYGDSPYQSFSSFAGNPYFIDLDLLAKDKLLKPREYQDLYWGNDPQRVDYGALYQNRFKVLRIASERLLKKKPADYQEFLEREKFWLDDYALFMTIKNSLGGKPVSEWPEDLRTRDHNTLMRTEFLKREDVRFWKSIQYMFFKQWKELRAYANSKGIGIIGDLPIYVAQDSVEVWANAEVFQLDAQGRAKDVAGCPPDGFTADGQLWGNPLYNWEYLAAHEYSWWIRRIEQQLKFYDVLRIDHFRGFAGYYAIPAADKNAKNGVWKKGPGIALFRAVEKKLGKVNIIAEDLGYLTDDVFELLDQCGYPGMKVLEFAFDDPKTASVYLPHLYTTNCVVYPGTHDNDTIIGWWDKAKPKTKAYVKEYFQFADDTDIAWKIIREAYASTASLAIVQYQDILGLGSEARMNEPSTTGKNWTWRLSAEEYPKEVIRKLKALCKMYTR